MIRDVDAGRDVNPCRTDQREHTQGGFVADHLKFIVGDGAVDDARDKAGIRREVIDVFMLRSARRWRLDRAARNRCDVKLTVRVCAGDFDGPAVGVRALVTGSQRCSIVEDLGSTGQDFGGYAVVEMKGDLVTVVAVHAVEVSGGDDIRMEMVRRQVGEDEIGIWRRGHKLVRVGIENVVRFDSGIAAGVPVELGRHHSRSDRRYRAHDFLRAVLWGLNRLVADAVAGFPGQCAVGRRVRATGCLVDHPFPLPDFS